MSTATAATKTKVDSARAFQIAVIGGGPKAAAIAAKASVLRKKKLADIHVTIFEPEAIGSYWSGKSGYTDGEQRLCTIAERDVGFPYNSMFGRTVDDAMARTFSWTQFKHSQSQGYSDWVDGGRKPPLHKEFAEYLQWVAKKVSRKSVTVVRERVTELAKDKRHWLLKSENRKGMESTYGNEFDAVVITGPGPAKHIEMKPAGSDAARSKIFNGSDFWSRIEEVRKCLEAAKANVSAENPIVIIGAGGTAAAILSWLITNGARDMQIEIVASQPTLYTRVDSVFENRLFSDESQWLALSSEKRKAFFERLNRGVVWGTVMDHVSSATRVRMQVGRAQSIEVPDSGEIQLLFKPDNGKEDLLRPSMLIDASGFDAWWFLSLLKGAPSIAMANKKERDTWQEDMDVDLHLKGTPWDDYPALHVPMLSSNLGPGFASLMVLGSMADRVLKPYVR